MAAATAAAAALQLAQAPQRHKLTRLLIFSSSEQPNGMYQQSGLELQAPASSVNSRAIIVHLVFLSLPETAGENRVGEAGAATCSGLSGGMVAVTNVCCCCSLLDKMEFHRLAII